MHWFDQMSQRVAAVPTAQATRRGVLGGAAVAVVGSQLLTSDAFTYASNRMKWLAGSQECRDCLIGAKATYNDLMADCAQRAANGKGNYAKKKKPTKPPKKTTPHKAAKETACQAGARRRWYQGINGCKGMQCRPTAPPPSGGVNPGDPGQGDCSPGTTKCGAAMCCFGGDNCCGCASAGGLICCAAVIGCKCCG